jgi:hypothetical protein
MWLWSLINSFSVANHCFFGYKDRLFINELTLTIICNTYDWGMWEIYNTYVRGSMIATCWFTIFIIQYICSPYYSNYLAMLYQWSHIWKFISTQMHDVEIHGCVWGKLHLYCSFVTLFWMDLATLSHHLPLPYGFSLCFSLVIFLTFYSPLALPIF